MISLSSSRLQARSTGCPCRTWAVPPCVPCTASRQHQVHRLRHVPAATGPEAYDDQIESSGGGAPGRFDDDTSMNPPSLKGQQTGLKPEGPSVVFAGQEVESSDTNPELDPSEKSKIADREGAGGGAQEAETRFRTSESSPGRDQTDKESGSGSGGGGGAAEEEKRSHPVARTAGTAIGTAAGTILGAVGGPVTAAAGAALGASAGRGLVDAMKGTTEQADVYEQGAEPEQVLEEAQRAAHEAKERVEPAFDRAAQKADRLTGEAKDRAHEAKHEAKHKSHEAKHDAKQTAHDAKHEVKQTAHDAKHEAKHKSHEARERSQSDKESKEHEGRGLGSSIANAAKSAADRVEAAADKIPFPQFPPEQALGEEEEDESKKGAKKRDDKSAGDAAVEGGWGSAAPTTAAGTDWVGDWGSESATVANEGLNLQGARVEGAEAQAARPMSDAGGSGLGGLGDAEAVVKADVGAPSMMLQDGMGMASAAETWGAAGREGTGSGAAGVKGASASGSAGGGGGGAQAVAEGRLAAGGDDAQAAVGVGPETTGAITSDSNAERIAQVYGVGPEASTGVKEADTYKAEADKQSEGGAGKKA